MINLVPPEIKKLKGVRSLGFVLTLGYIVVTAALLLGLAGLVTYNYTQKIALGSEQAELDRLVAEKSKNKTIVDQAALIQNRVKSVANYKDAYDWNQVLVAVANSTPTNIRLTSIKVSSDADKPPTVTMTGETGERRSIVLFKDKLALTKPFSGASISSITESTAENNKTYTFSMSVGITKK
ncbi:MAG: PilN domain-containing protein [bacterium]|nr:PilN domain-containing protein [bacterium]